MSWTQAGFHALGHKVIFTDLVGNVCALCTLWLGDIPTIWTWLVQLIGSELLWVIVDVVGVPLAFSSGLVMSGAVYGVFFVMVLIGFRGWLLQYRAQTAQVQDLEAAA
jgi:nicotinamide mononucleotide transporter